MTNLDIVKGIYESFGRGDVPAILARLRDDVEWEHDNADHGIPWILPGRGRAHVGTFFAAVGQHLEPRGFAVAGLLEGDRTVAALVQSDWIVKRTQRSLHDAEVHLWTFDAEGRVARFRHVIDTAAHLAAAR